MVLLENDAFLSEVTRLFQKTKTSGTLNITMKRYDGRTTPKVKNKKTPEPSEYKCLFRAAAGNKKITTIVNQKDVNKFQMAYANVMKGNIDGLKKKDKKTAATKAKIKAKA